MVAIPAEAVLAAAAPQVALVSAEAVPIQAVDVQHRAVDLRVLCSAVEDAWVV